MPIKAMTPEFRVSYPNVFKPAKKMKPEDPERYTLDALFDVGCDLSGLKKAANEAVIEKWGSDPSKWPKNLRNPFKDQGEKDKPGYVKGAIFVTLKSEQKPGIVDENVQDIIEQRNFYAGCYARASVVATAYDFQGNRGVSFWVNNIQKLRDGEALGGRTNAADDFQPVAAQGGSGSAASSVF